MARSGKKVKVSKLMRMTRKVDAGGLIGHRRQVVSDKLLKRQTNTEPLSDGKG